MTRIINVVGARPNFMKMAPIVKEMKKFSDIESVLVHTGQHYDSNMSSLFFDQLNLPQPDMNLCIGSGSHAEQTGNIMIIFEKVLMNYNPDLVMVVGDVNSTLACSLTASKMNIPVAHVEAGLRSFDKSMPEEINRRITDCISDVLFSSCMDANINLMNENISSNKIFLVGNVMIDSLNEHLPKAKALNMKQKLGLNSKEYALVTLHRPSNVDSRENLEMIVDAFSELSDRIKIVFPAHPRTVKMLERFSLLDNIRRRDNLYLSDPMGYLEFMSLMQDSKLVITDSGGIQEETTFLDIPCLTLRNNTERPVTVTEGTNKLVRTESAEIIKEVEAIIDGKGKSGKPIKYWDGKAAERIVGVLRGMDWGK